MMNAIGRPDPSGRDARDPLLHLSEALAMLREELNRLESVPDLPGAGQDRIRRLHGHLDRASGLTRQLEDAGRSGWPCRQRVDVHLLLGSLQTLLRAHQSEPLPSVSFDLDPSGAWVEGDSVLLSQLLLALLT